MGEMTGISINWPEVLFLVLYALIFDELDVELVLADSLLVLLVLLVLCEASGATLLGLNPFNKEAPAPFAIKERILFISSFEYDCWLKNTTAKIKTIMVM